MNRNGWLRRLNSHQIVEVYAHNGECQRLDAQGIWTGIARAGHHETLVTRVALAV